MNDSPGPQRTTNLTPHRSGRETVRESLAFWGCLLCAIGAYALVTLSPKVVRWSNRADQFAVNQQQLLLLREEIEAAKRLAHDMQRSLSRFQVTDAAFPIGDGSTEIVVEEPLRYHGMPRTPPEGVPSRSRMAALALFVMRKLAHSSLLRIGGLVTSAVLLIGAFSCFAGRSSKRRSADRGWSASRDKSPRHSLLSRYRLHPSTGRSAASSEPS